jgi:DNA-binding MarR family transcriptional regulator
MNPDLNSLPMLFSALHKKMMEQHQQFLLEVGLSKMHVPYLMILAEHQEGLTQKEMIDQLFLDKAHASRALRDLIMKKMIRKDEETIYKNKYYLEEKGRNIIKNMRETTQALRMKIFSSLDDDEVALFKRLSEKLLKLLE